MFRRLRRALTLRPSDSAYAIRAFFYLVRSGWIIFFQRKSATAVQEWITAGSDANDVANGDFEYERAALWVRRVARVPFPWARCYQRSVALSVWMHRQGLTPELKFGSRRTARGIDAHSWVEYEGRVINDSPNVREVFGTFSRVVPDGDTARGEKTG